MRRLLDGQVASGDGDDLERRTLVNLELDEIDGTEPAINPSIVGDRAIRCAQNNVYYLLGETGVSGPWEDRSSLAS